MSEQGESRTRSTQCWCLKLSISQRLTQTRTSPTTDPNRKFAVVTKSTDHQWPWPGCTQVHSILAAHQLLTHASLGGSVPRCNSNNTIHVDGQGCHRCPVPVSISLPHGLGGAPGAEAYCSSLGCVTAPSPHHPPHWAHHQVHRGLEEVGGEGAPRYLVSCDVAANPASTVPQTVAVGSPWSRYMRSKYLTSPSTAHCSPWRLQSAFQRVTGERGTKSCFLPHPPFHPTPSASPWSKLWSAQSCVLCTKFGRLVCPASCQTRLPWRMREWLFT